MQSSDKQRASHVDVWYCSTLKVIMSLLSIPSKGNVLTPIRVTHSIINRGKLVLIPTCLFLSIHYGMWDRSVRALPFEGIENNDTMTFSVEQYKLST